VVRTITRHTVGLERSSLVGVWTVVYNVQVCDFKTDSHYSATHRDAGLNGNATWKVRLRLLVGTLVYCCTHKYINVCCKMWSPPFNWAGWSCSSTLQNNEMRPQMFCCFWSDAVELAPVACLFVIHRWHWLSSVGFQSLCYRRKSSWNSGETLVASAEGRVLGEVSPPQPTRGSGEYRELPNGVRGRAPTRKAFLAYFECHRTLLFVCIF